MNFQNTINRRTISSFVVAGHGVLLQNQYYMLTHDYNGRWVTRIWSADEIVRNVQEDKIPETSYSIFDTAGMAGRVDT